jgi:hypothetical protein
MLFDAGEDHLNHSLGGSCPAVAMVDLAQPRARRRKSIKF